MRRGRRRSGLTDEAFQRLVDLAYEAGADAEHWPTFLAEYTELLGDRTASLSYHDLASHTGELTLGYRTEPEWERSYVETYAAENPWTSRGAAQMPPATHRRLAIVGGDTPAAGVSRARQEYRSCGNLYG